MTARALRPTPSLGPRSARLLGCFARLALAGMPVLGMALAQAEPNEEPPRTPAERAAAVTFAPREAPSPALHADVQSARALLPPPGRAALSADGRVMNEMASVHLRLWRSHGRAAWGLGVGTLGYVQPADGARSAESPLSLAGATPSLSLGMRYRMSPESAVFADASGTRALPPDMTPYVATKVGMEWKPATSRFGLDHGALGMQFDSGYRLSLKARKDGLRLYLRGQF